MTGRGRLAGRVNAQKASLAHSNRPQSCFTGSGGRCLDQNHRGGCDRQTTRGPPRRKTPRNCLAGAKLRRVESHERCRVQKPAKRRNPAARGLERRAERDAPANALRRAANRRKMTGTKRHCLSRQAKDRKSERTGTRGFGSTERSWADGLGHPQHRSGIVRDDGIPGQRSAAGLR